MSFKRNTQNTSSFVMSQSGQTHESQDDDINHIEHTSSTSDLISVSQSENQPDPLGRFKGYFIVGLLCGINLINYCDRYTLAS